MSRCFIQLMDEEVRFVAGTSIKECWICDEILKHITPTLKLNRKWLKDNDFEEHLAQIIGKDLVFF